jgi:chloramphenicol O-acetyltransferase
MYNLRKYKGFNYMPRRNDSTYVYNVQTLKKLFPFLMPRKCDSLVYIDLDLDLTKTLEFIQNNISASLDRKYRVFEILISALVRLIVLRPELNRFIMNKRLWQRNEISLNFIVKEEYKDEAPEHSIILRFDPNSTLEEIAIKVNEKIDEARDDSSINNNNGADRLVSIFSAFPPIILTAIVSFIKFLDTKGLAPKSIIDEDGLHCTAYLSNLGSIGLKNSSVHHHLYQWGTTSLFITIGSLSRKRIKKNNSIERCDTINLGITLDERIADGYYFIKSLRVLQDLLNNPEQLLIEPNKIKERPAKSRRELKKRLKLKKEIS